MRGRRNVLPPLLHFIVDCQVKPRNDRIGRINSYGDCIIRYDRLPARIA
jgi:hypothetical protein